MKEPIYGVPEGCMEIPGLILVLVPGESWLTKDGEVTTNFRERGVWDTVEEADAAKERFCQYHHLAKSWK